MYNENGAYIINWSVFKAEQTSAKQSKSIASKLDDFVLSFGVLTVVRLWSIAAIITTAYAISSSLLK